MINKRAQRALGRSPEEKVKGHSGANNREPQGHNLNNFGKGPFDEVTVKRLLRGHPWAGQKVAS